MIIHDFSPIALQLGPLAVRWYSLAYIFGIIFGGVYINYLNNKLHLVKTDKKDIEDLLFRIILGILIGGRLAYVIFYNPIYYLYNPVEILFVWQGGMSFHGGITGCALGVLYHARKTGQSFLPWMDLVACGSAIGLFFGRIANFINGELFGKVTTMPWGVVFQGGGDVTRHPSQLYEALSEGLITFLIMLFFVHIDKVRKHHGSLSGIFLICYGISRISVEFFRIPDEQIGYFLNVITMGQILTFPMIILGAYLIIRENDSRKKN
jgi:phosphatidylglycerol:prolipoprotein diacylglycerol transferase